MDAGTTGWRPIADAPRDGTPVDLWIVGVDRTVDFYSPTAEKVKGKPLRHGRACDFVWAQKLPNPPNWYPMGCFTDYPLSPEVTATHFMRHPFAPDLPR